MYYTIYQTTNLINGKIYIGKHQTKDLNDGYMGSGKYLKRAITKYGAINFCKKILFSFSSEKEMDDKEHELVNEEFLTRSDVYNICIGGQGGFGYINKTQSITIPRNRKNSRIHLHKIDTDVEYRHRWKEALKKSNTTEVRKKRADAIRGRVGTFQGKKHNSSAKLKMQISKNKGPLNSQFGTIWITNGVECKKIKKQDPIPPLWKKGRTIL